MAKRSNDFQTIRSEGGLLPPDLLRRVLNPKERLAGPRPEDYGLPQGERLNEVITQSWNRLRRRWAEFSELGSRELGGRGTKHGIADYSPTSLLATRYPLSDAAHRSDQR